MSDPSIQTLFDILDGTQTLNFCEPIGIGTQTEEGK